MSIFSLHEQAAILRSEAQIQEVTKTATEVPVTQQKTKTWIMCAVSLPEEKNPKTTLVEQLCQKHQALINMDARLGPQPAHPPGNIICHPGK